MYLEKMNLHHKLLLQTVQTQDTFLTQNPIVTTSTVNPQTLNNNESVSVSQTSTLNMQTFVINDFIASNLALNILTPITDLNNTSSTFISSKHIPKSNYTK